MESNRVNKTTDSRCLQNQNMPLPLDAPWEHVLQSGGPHLPDRSRVEKRQFLSGEATGVEGLLPRSQPGSSQLRRPSLSESPSPILSAYSGSTHSRGYESNSPPPPALEYERVYYRQPHDSSYSLTSVTPGTSPSSTGNFAKPQSGGHEFAFGRPVGSTESLPYVSTSEHECSDFGAAAERGGGRAGGQGAIAHRPRPFSRKSKAGTQHTVTPSAAGPEGGFVCSFSSATRGTCGMSFKLPSDIRSHLIETHMTFSPFQCDKCKRVYTRKSLYTRHLKESPPGSHRQCPNRLADADEAFFIRQETYTALWAIQVTQGQVDQAVRMIKRHNGMLPSRRRRTPNVNETDPPGRRPSVGPQASPESGSPDGSPRDDTTPRSPQYPPHAYPVPAPRGVPSPNNYFTPQRRSPSPPPFATPDSFHAPPNFEPTPSDITDAPFGQPPFDQGYPSLPDGHIDPGVLHQPQRHPSWDARPEFGSWPPPSVRVDYRYGNPHAQQHGFKDGYQFQTGRSEDTHYNAHTSRSPTTKRFSPKGENMKRSD